MLRAQTHLAGPKQKCQNSKHDKGQQWKVNIVGCIQNNPRGFIEMLIKDLSTIKICLILT